MTNDPLDRDQLDPVFLNSRREAVVIFLTWAAAFLWAVPYCALNAYETGDISNLKLIWGIPHWVFWGIAVPWLLADVVTVWICFGLMQDDDLSVQEAGSSEHNGHDEGGAA